MKVNVLMALDKPTISTKKNFLTKIIFWQQTSMCPLVNENTVWRVLSTASNSTWFFALDIIVCFLVDFYWCEHFVITIVRNEFHKREILDVSALLTMFMFSNSSLAVSLLSWFSLSLCSKNNGVLFSFRFKSKINHLKSGKNLQVPFDVCLKSSSSFPVPKKGEIIKQWP